ncbi:MAG: hypothetical protein JWR61_5107 [Ferruginibacter sp.]|uniref:DUF3857 domain-containing protein n=1 Tax=Ferruginibacter sp. TaxID=1940288 RepID=UPI002657CEF6|nr:DUF3857 domain-containing protein [Ferruginibacter sp.]MDB5280152.1 hypothetical protein [Ferruginibacter sp.]
MTRTLITTLLFLFIFSATRANDYDDAWNAIHKKNYKEAKALLQKGIKNPATALDSYCTLLYLQTYLGKETEIEGLIKEITANADKNAYLYSLWFNGSVLGQYSKKQAYQLNLLNQIEKDNSFNGSIRQAAKYVKAMHAVFSNDYASAEKEWKQINSVQEWQFAGPFENLSGSGFNMQPEPLADAGAESVFNGMNNVEVKWFKPSEFSYEGWVFCYPFIQQSSAIEYAQAFVYVPEDTKAVLNAGVNGSLKIWVNDGLLLSESKERITELDYYKKKCQLKKGYNRVLVQLGYTDNTLPNFIVRFTDDASVPLPNCTSTAVVQPYIKAAIADSTGSLKHFAELFFETKIKEQPFNLVNYILLSQTYLRDSKKTEARLVIEDALKIASGDPLLRFELMQISVKSENRTLLLQEIDWLKENDSLSYINLQMEIQTLINTEKYTEADVVIEKMTSLFGEDENIIQLKAAVLGKLDKIEELLKLVEKGYARYPENVSFVDMMFRVKKLVQKDSKAAVKVYELYLKNNYNFSIIQNLADEYKELGQDADHLATLKKINTMGLQDPRMITSISNYYIEKREYANALAAAQKAIALAPSVGLYWHNIASIYEQMNNTEDALKSYKKDIYYNRTDYDARKKISVLSKKLELYKLLPETDVYALIKKSTIDAGYDYTYLLDEKGAVLYDEGASEEYITYVIKINTQKGIDNWKEVNLASGNSQSILVEKCEVVKVNGSKVAAERNEGTAVFTGLQTGDAIYVKYRLQNYATGRLGRAFWDKFIFNSFAPSQNARYILIAPQALQLNYKFSNNTASPVIKEVEDFKVYTWELNNLPPVKSEPLMPPLNDVASVLHISTIKTWADVAGWYSDISYQDLKDNFELEAAYNEIFRNKIAESNFAKAKRIYEYIVNNIRYSSVAFRQNGYVPQNLSKVLNTKLGDCKDLSSLFVALTARAGINAQLVLIDTRNNGMKDMDLPSMEFNHCISLLHVDGKEYYIELTDSNLPFGSLPSNLNGALSLIIPLHGQKSEAILQPLTAVNRMRDESLRKIRLSFSGNDAKLNVETKRCGAIVSAWRNEYASLGAEKQKESFEQSLSNANKNPVKLDTVSFTGLAGNGDTLTIKSTYTIKNELVEAGSMKMLKIPFLDVVATLESLSADKREYPVEYWNYENTDVYETIIEVQAPSGRKLLECPADKNFSFKNSTYSLKFIRTPTLLKIIRKVSLNRNDIKPEDYKLFKKFFNDIVEIESKYLVFK